MIAAGQCLSPTAAIAWRSLSQLSRVRVPLSPRSPILSLAAADLVSLGQGVAWAFPADMNFTILRCLQSHANSRHSLKRLKTDATIAALGLLGITT